MLEQGSDWPGVFCRLCVGEQISSAKHVEYLVLVLVMILAIYDGTRGAK